MDLVDARWQRLGLSTARRRELRIDLVTDLSQARLDGAPLEELLAVDPDRFATDVAVAYGWAAAEAGTSVDAAAVAPTRSLASSEPPVRAVGHDRVPVGRVVVAGTLGSAVGGIVSLVLLLPFIGWVNQHPQLDYAAQALAMLGIYATAALVGAVGGGFAVASACADRPERRLLGRRATAGLILSGVAATILTVGFADSTGYSTRPPVVLSEVALVLSTCVVGLVIAATSVSPARRDAVGHTE